MDKIILSINPQWIEKMRQKIKLIEIRKTKPKTPFISSCYETKKFGGCGEITSEFQCDQVDRISENDLENIDILKFICRYAGVTEKELKLYIKNKKYIYLWYIKNFKDIKHKKINHIPQSWIYDK